MVAVGFSGKRVIVFFFKGILYSFSFVFQVVVCNCLSFRRDWWSSFDAAVRVWARFADVEEIGLS